MSWSLSDSPTFTQNRVHHKVHRDQQNKIVPSAEDFGILGKLKDFFYTINVYDIRHSKSENFNFVVESN